MSVRQRRRQTGQDRSVVSCIMYTIVRKQEVARQGEELGREREAVRVESAARRAAETRLAQLELQVKGGRTESDK